MNAIKATAQVIMALALSAAIMYATYWMFKTGSYFFFYESMVQSDIIEMVKPECLIK